MCVSCASPSLKTIITFITTGSFSKAATEEASAPGKQQIDLIDGEEYINKLAEFGIGVHEIKDYEIDEDYFAKI